MLEGLREGEIDPLELEASRPIGRKGVKDVLQRVSSERELPMRCAEQKPLTGNVAVGFQESSRLGRAVTMIVPTDSAPGGGNPRCMAASIVSRNVDNVPAIAHAMQSSRMLPARTISPCRAQLRSSQLRRSVSVGMFSARDRAPEGRRPRRG